MKLSMKEKKILYAFACPSHHNTVTRLKWLTALTVDPEVKCRILGLARKMEMEVDESWYEAENLAIIYTFNASLKRRLADFSRKYPLLYRLERSTPEGSVTYVVDKSWLSIRLILPYSEERKAAASAYAEVRKIEQRISEFTASHPVGRHERSRSLSAGVER